MNPLITRLRLMRQALMTIFSKYRDTMGVFPFSSPAFVGVFLFALITSSLLPQLALAKDPGITRRYKFDVCIIWLWH